MLNAARPYIDVTLDKYGYPLAIQPRDFFKFMEAHHDAAYNNRTPNVGEKALVLEGMSTRVKDYCLSFKGHQRGEFALVQVRGPGLSCLRPRFKLPPAPV